MELPSQFYIKVVLTNGIVMTIKNGNSEYQYFYLKI